ncbi:MAG TPA: Holliday junction branch migration protein RuvA [Solirubrobacteraceae bacterium]|jgi:Holliday junction DNA helicase RuvA
MISLLKGEVALRRPDHVVVLCGGVGYRAAVSAETLRHVPAIGSEVTLHTHLISREDALLLFGFHSEQERDLFLMLISVQAVGPKIAIAILSTGGARELMSAIAAGDAKRFTSVPGIGKRTAERVIVELREKVGVHAAGLIDGPAGGGTSVSLGEEDPFSLARAGLLELGYSAIEAERLLAGAEGESAEQLLAGALKAARTR